MTPKRYNPVLFPLDGKPHPAMTEKETGDYVHIDDYNILAQRYAELLEKTNTLAESGTEDERELFTEDDVKEAFFGKDQPENPQNLTFPYWD